MLGDIVGSRPIYLKESLFAYTGGAFANREPRVIVGANDGMLHAFDASDDKTKWGKEIWAYVPGLVLKDMYKLADVNYQHQFYADGEPTIVDFFDSSWKTLLVSGLNKGGKGYYAIDISDANDPKPLWEYTDSEMGYTYGRPIVTKLSNDQWVVIFTSGYNATADKLVVLDAKSGSVVKTIKTGSAAGLAKISAWIDDFDADNKAKFVYGGDLNGVMWRFDLDSGAASKLIDLGPGQPITAKPELAEVNGKRVVYFGSGQILTTNDLLVTANKYGLYGVADKDATASISDLESMVVDASTGKVTGNPLDWVVKSGFVARLPNGGERSNIDPKIAAGKVVYWTNTPTDFEAESCSGNGVTRLYVLDFKKGTGSTTTVAEELSVGGTIVMTSTGKLKDISRRPSGSTDTVDGGEPMSGGKGRRVTWREVVSQ
nr:PilC/PilY family type IV pilus protein [Chitinivorax tropicus]